MSSSQNLDDGRLQWPIGVVYRYACLFGWKLVMMHTTITGKSFEAIWHQQHHGLRMD